MKQVSPEQNWPETWKYSHTYDRLELYGDGSLRGYSYAYDTRRRQTIELVQKVAGPDAAVLDVAAAQGNFSLALAELGYHVTWNDLRGDLAGYVQLKHEHGEIDYAPGNVFDLDLEGRFDVVLITEIIEHVAHPDEFLKKIAILVKPGGYIVLSTPNGGYFQNKLPKFSKCADPSQFEKDQFKPNSDGHIFLLHPDEIDVLAQYAALSVCEKRLFTNPLTNGHLKTEALLKILPRSFIEATERLTSSLPLALSCKLNIGMAVLLQRPC